MSELLLTALSRQAMLLSLGALLLLALRPLLLKRLGARATYAAWLLLPALLLTPLLPNLGAPAPPALVTVAELARTAAAPLGIAPQPEAIWPRLLMAAWLGGAALVLALQATRQWRLARHGTRLPAGASPALVGLWRPRVALPADFEARFSPEERRLILTHEDVHRTRHDNAWKLLACLLTALHWWNPLAWLAARRMQADQELACDAVVLSRQPGALAAYTRALLAAHDLTPHGAPLASRWGSAHPLVERIAMLNRPHSLPGRRAAALGLLLAGITGLAYAAQADAPAAAPGADALAGTIELKMDLSYTTRSGEQRDTSRTQLTLRVAPGTKAMLMLKGAPDKPTPEQVAIQIEPKNLGDGRIELRAEVKKGDPLSTVSRPRLITGNGVKARIEQGRDDASAAEHLSLAITPTLLKPQNP